MEEKRIIKGKLYLRGLLITSINGRFPQEIINEEWFNKLLITLDNIMAKTNPKTAAKLRTLTPDLYEVIKYRFGLDDDGEIKTIEDTANKFNISEYEVEAAEYRAINLLTRIYFETTTLDEHKRPIPKKRERKK